MKKSMFLILVLAMLLGNMTACENEAAVETTADTVAAPEETTLPPETEPPLPGPEIVDMDGVTLTIANYPATGGNMILPTENTGEVLNDALFNRKVKVEDLYNCILVEEGTAGTGLLNEAAKVGEAGFDVALLFDASVGTQMGAGNLLTWEKLPELNLDNVWWDEACTEQYNFLGSQVAVTGAYNLSNHATRYCYIFNKDMLTDIANGTDLYSIVNEGKWTQDVLFELASMAVIDSNGDGIHDPYKDKSGIVGSVANHHSGLIAGAGIHYIDRREDGTLYFTITGNEYAQTVIAGLVEIEKAEGLFVRGDEAHLADKFDHPAAVDNSIFLNGDALFYAAYVKDMITFREMEDNIGLVPYPKYNEEQQGYHTLVCDGNHTVLSIALQPSEYRKVAIIMDALGYYSYIESLPAYVEVILKDKMTRDNESEDMLEIIFSTEAYDLGTGMWSEYAKNIFSKDIFMKSSTDIASVCAKNINRIEKTLANFEKQLLKIQEKNQ